MSPDEQGPGEGTEAKSAPEAAEPEWKRRRRLAEIFGDVLPETTRDERDDAAPRTESANDAWLRAQVPPHHGGGRSGL